MAPQLTPEEWSKYLILGLDLREISISVQSTEDQFLHMNYIYIYIYIYHFPGAQVKAAAVYGVSDIALEAVLECSQNKLSCILSRWHESK